MAVTDRKVHPEARLAEKALVVSLVTATAQGDVKAFSLRPGYGFQVIGVQAYCRSEVGAVTADVKIGTTSVLSAAVAFVTATRVDGVLAASLAARRGTAAGELNVHFTSDGTGALTNGFVVVTIRPYPLNQEAE